MIISVLVIFLCVIVIEKNQANIVVVTLEEKRTITNAKYLFKFENDQSKDISYCIPTDTSSYPERYNKFSITDTANPLPLSGQVNLKSGFHHYYIYEQASSTNLNPAGLTLVEQGKALCIDVLPTDYTHTVTLTEKVYNG